MAITARREKRILPMLPVACVTPESLNVNPVTDGTCIARVLVHQRFVARRLSIVPGTTEEN
jgi:hypothetical protein